MILHTAYDVGDDVEFFADEHSILLQGRVTKIEVTVYNIDHTEYWYDIAVTNAPEYNATYTAPEGNIQGKTDET